MSLIRSIIVLAALASACYVAVVATRRALDDPNGRDPDGVGATAASEPRDATGSLSTETTDSAETVPDPRGVKSNAAASTPPDGMRDTESEPPPTLSASELATLETEAERWSFDVPKDLDRLAAFLESAPSESNARVVSTWFLARQLHGSSDDATRIPDTVHRVDLRNGSALYARSVRRDDETVRITTLTGIETTLPSGKVQTTTEIRRDAYLSQTRDDFTKDLAQLDRQRVSDVESGLRRALRRRDLAVADELFRDWIAAGGPARLAKRTSRERHPGVHLAVAHLAPTLPSTPDVASSAPTKPSDATSSELPPRSLEDLATRIDAVYRKTRNRRVAKKDVERWVDAVAVWEEWLERRVADNGVTENVNDLRQRLQHLRLDLLKMSGF